MKAPGFMLYFDDYDKINSLDDAQLGRLLRSLFEFADSGREPTNLDPATDMAFKFISSKVILGIDKYNAKCERNRMNGKLGGRPKRGIEKPNGFLENPQKPNGFLENPKSNNNNKSKRTLNEKESRQTATRFRPPTIKDVQDFCDDEGLSIDTQRFVNYYAAQGWKLSNGNNMKDWHAAARNWARKDGQEQQSVLDIPATNATDYQQGFR